MSLKVFQNQDYEFTHEREQFRNLLKVLKERYDKTEDLNLLFANIYFGGVPLDALFIKRDAIIVLEFKNYAGKLTVSENGNWELNDGTIVKGGAGKNPYMQTRANKFSVLSELNQWFPRPYVNLGQISGVVVFNQPVSVVKDYISPKSKSWFHICDMNSIGDKIEDITSPGIKYTDSDLLNFPRILNCTEALYESPVTENPGPVETPVIQQPIVQNLNTTLSDTIRKILKDNRYEIVAEKDKPGKEAEYYKGNIELGKKAKKYIEENYTSGLYNHQYEAAKLASEGNNVCIATSTSSGKTAIFHLAALEVLERDPEAKIIAVYPMKALGNQQVDSWNSKLPNIKCGRIDGNVRDVNERLRIIEECSVITFTPDTVHTFLLGKLKDTRCTNIIKNFLRKLKLVIIDEVHLYRGMLGSNSAYLFRRLNACAYLAGNNVPQYITASATIAEPLEHSLNITGVDSFEIIGPDIDSSPSCPTKIFFIRRGNGVEYLVKKLKEDLPDNSRTITFIDNRQDVERVVSEIDNAPNINQREIFSFRAGYEDEFYNQTLDALRNNRFKGVVSTSSLEVGIDIANLNVAILDGIPSSSTSFYQRIGRVGRGNTNDEAVVIIMEKPNSINTYLAFNDPQGFSLPPEEPALYLQNVNLLNIQALHFVDTGAELQSVADRNVLTEYEKIKNFFPQEFNDVCINVLNEQLDGLAGYRTIMDKGGDYPEVVFTIRNFDVQFTVFPENDVENTLEVLTMQNILREAYPGAIHSCQNRLWRVRKVDRPSSKVELRNLNQEERRNKTKINSVVCVTPQRMSEIKGHNVYGDLHIVNLKIDEKTTIRGFSEYDSYGHQIRKVDYSTRNPYYNNVGNFKYTLPTEGVIICHPALMGSGNNRIQVSLIATLLYNCFLCHSAFERSDIENRAGILTTEIDGIKVGTPFLTIYDKNTNGLNITSRLMDHKELLSGFDTMVKIINECQEENFLGDVSLNRESKDAIRKMHEDLKNNEGAEIEVNSRISEFHIAKRSKALYVRDEENNDIIEVTIDSVLKYDDGSITYVLCDVDGKELEEEVPEGQVIPIEGVSYKGRFANNTSMRSINTQELW